MATRQHIILVAHVSSLDGAKVAWAGLFGVLLVIKAIFTFGTNLFPDEKSVRSQIYYAK